MPKLEYAVRHEGETVLSKKAVKYQVAAEAECSAMTGFVKNAITPFGIPQGLFPVVVAAGLTKARPSYVWLGGGEVDLKLRIPVKQLLVKLNARVLDCAIPRAAGAGDDSD